MASEKQGQASETLPPLPTFEYGLLGTPWEIGAQAMRQSHRSVEKELPPSIGFMIAMKLKTSKDREDCLTRLTKLEEKVSNLIEGVRSNTDMQKHQFRKCRTRVTELADDCKVIKAMDNANTWDFNKPFGPNSKYIMRLLATYLSSSGYLDTARAMIQKEGLEDLVDIRVYEELETHLDHLEQGDLAHALEWCSKHRGILKKKESTLEATLHFQQFLLLIGKKEYGKAIRLLRSNISAKNMESCKDFSKAIAMSIFDTPPNAEYGQLSTKNVLEEIKLRFAESFRQVYNQPIRPLLEILVEVGFISLASPVCSEGVSASCPCCDKGWQPLLAGLPICHKSRSILLDPETGEVINQEENPPVAAPSGIVYGQQQVAKMARIDNDMVSCAITNEPIRLAEFQRVYIT